MAGNGTGLYKTHDAQFLIYPNQDGGNFLLELNAILYGDNGDKKNPDLHAFTYDPKDGTSITLNGAKQASKSPTDNLYLLLGGNVMAICATADDDKQMLPILKISLNEIPHADFIQQDSLSSDPAKLYELVRKYSANGRKN